jgi:porin
MPSNRGRIGLPREFKIGGWFDTAPDPNASSSQPWNYGFYFVGDQMLYRVRRPVPAPTVDNYGQEIPAALSTDKGLGFFTHIGLALRNSSLINFYIDGGLNYKGLVPTRDSDILGVSIAYGHLRDNAEDVEGRSNPGYEIVFEATYQMELATWLSLQPDLQYVIHPSGTNIANAFVLGARTTVSF